MGKFQAKNPKTPIQGFGPRVKNVVYTHFRGLVGFIVPLIILPLLGGEHMRHDLTTRAVWYLMIWFFIWQPVNVPVVGMIPLFLFPMLGVITSDRVGKCYFTEGTTFALASTMLFTLWNVSGLAKRVALNLMCSGDNCQFSGKRMVFKTGCAAFILAMFSNRLISTLMMYDIITPIYKDLVANNKAKGDPDFSKMQYIINSAIHTSSAFGGLVFLHGSFTLLFMRHLWLGANPKLENIFNYLQYTTFSVPLAVGLFFLNIGYHMLLINCCVGKPMNAAHLTSLRNAFIGKRSTLKKINAHERLSVLFIFLALAMMVYRWSQWKDYTWTAPDTLDATVMCLFVFLLHCLPRSLRFIKFFTAEKAADFPPTRPCSSILWWNYIDKNTNYGYMFLFGGGLALHLANVQSGYFDSLAYDTAFGFDKGWLKSTFIVVFLSVLFANMMSGTAACAVFTPLVLTFARTSTWTGKVHIGALAVALGTNSGVLLPFLYTPAYFCYHTGKTPLKRMIRYASGTFVLSVIMIWLAIAYYAPVVWPSVAINPKYDVTTTPAPPVEPGPEPPPPEG